MIALSACSSSGSGNNGGTTSSAAGDAASGSPINLGFICSCSGALASSYGKTTDAIEIWSKAVNASGGLDGHPVKLFEEDDAGDPVKGLAAAKALVEQDKVVAIVGYSSVVGTSFGDYLASKNIPVIGGENDIAFDKYPLFFSLSGSASLVTFGFVNGLRLAGVKHMGSIYCAEAPVCGEVNTQAAAIAKSLGLKYTALKVTATQPNYNAQCETMKQAGVDGLFPSLGVATAVKVVDDCAQLGYKPKLTNGGGSIGAQVLNDPNYEGDLVPNATASYTDTSVPGTKEMLDTMNKYDSSLVQSSQFGFPVQAAYLGGKLLEAAVRAAGSSFQPTSAGILAGLYALNGETLGGTTPPLTYEKGVVKQPTCYFSTTVHNKQLVMKQLAPICLTSDQQQALKEALAG